jgi:hypothetical protein
MRFIICTAWIGWFLLPFLAMCFEYWRWGRAPRIARRKKARELLRAAQERFGLTQLRRIGIPAENRVFPPA